MKLRWFLGFGRHAEELDQAAPLGDERRFVSFWEPSAKRVGLWVNQNQARQDQTWKL
jgi:hypothetical protein